MLIFQHTVNSRALNSQRKQCQNSISQLEKCIVIKCIRIYRCLWRSLGGGGGTFWLLNESMTYKGPAAWQATAVHQIGGNKIPPNFDTLFATSLEVIWLFKGLTARRL
jgi:hypothetical protein